MAQILVPVVPWTAIGASNFDVRQNPPGAQSLQLWAMRVSPAGHSYPHDIKNNAVAIRGISGITAI